MAVNLYDYANQLEQALRDSDEYKAIKDAFSKVKANEDSKRLFDEFRETQLNLQQKQMQKFQKKTCKKRKNKRKKLKKMKIFLS